MILVVNPKGGCGKTTIATNLATYYAVWDIPTALVDLDPQQSSMEWLRVRPDSENSVQGFDGLKGKIFPDEGTERIIYDAPARTDTNRANNADAIIGVVANRTQKNYQSYKALVTFLRKLNVPFIGALRNSQNYIKAADSGVGIFEMPLSDVKADMAEWKPIINWVEGKRVLK